MPVPLAAEALSKTVMVAAALPDATAAPPNSPLLFKTTCGLALADRTPEDLYSPTGLRSPDTWAEYACTRASSGFGTTVAVGLKFVSKSVISVASDSSVQMRRFAARSIRNTTYFGLVVL